MKESNLFKLIEVLFLWALISSWTISATVITISSSFEAVKSRYQALQLKEENFKNE